MYRNRRLNETNRPFDIENQLNMFPRFNKFTCTQKFLNIVSKNVDTMRPLLNFFQLLFVSVHHTIYMLIAIKSKMASIKSKIYSHDKIIKKIGFG